MLLYFNTTSFVHSYVNINNRPRYFENFSKQNRHFLCQSNDGSCNIENQDSIQEYFLSKCPGGHPILHRGLKLNSKISAKKYKKIKLTEASRFSTGELSKNYVEKIQRFHKMCCYFGQNPKHKGNISPSNFDGQLPNILFTCLCLCYDLIGNAKRLNYFLV